MRYFFEISYEGTRYNGWQSQLNAIGIQTIVEDALSKIFRSSVTIVASGRTDTGVHCRQQFFHTDLTMPFDQDQLMIKLNSLLPKDIAIHSIRKAKPDAHARYDAVERTYHYFIVREKDPFSQGRAWFCYKSLDIKTMNEAAALLKGMQDFECFSKVKTDVNHFLCDIKVAEWEEKGKFLQFTITANRFLRGMVRAIIGTLVDVGSGKTSKEEFETIIKSRNRKLAGANVPAHGLYLVRVKYPDTVFEDREYSNNNIE
jgi:tRNA pseudouridine38-40 synthase